MNQNRRKAYLIESALTSEGKTMTKYYYLANQVDMSSCEMLKSFNITYDMTLY